MRCSIPVPWMRAVERVDEGTFQHPHVMQIVAQDGAGQLHTTYIQCKVGAPLPSLGTPGTPHPSAPGAPSPAPSRGAPLDPMVTMGTVLVPNPAIPKHQLYWEHWGAQPWLYWGQGGVWALAVLGK